jgi:cysteine desulfurase/selenocysteine lyase
MSELAERAIRTPLDTARLRRDFPILAKPMRGRRLAFLDSAASTQKPEVVIEAEADCYRSYYANIHRGVYELSQKSTLAYDGVRKTVARFINAPDPREIVFLRGTTEAINLVADSFVAPRLGAGDEILITGMEHHSNIVPWQLVAERTGARLVVSPVTDDGEIDVEDFRSRLNDRTRFASVVHVSNALGTINPVRELARAAHAAGVPILVDGAQAAPHMAVDVQALGCDFYCFSGHKIYGPSGVGVLWGRMEHLRGMRPYQGGGDMIRSVSFEGTTYAEPPQRFEAGTPNIAGVIGMGRAIEYLEEVGLDNIARHEAALLTYANAALADIDGLHILGNPREKAGVISFTIDGAHPHDIGTILDQEGVAIRAGHHCVQPLMRHFGVAATARASFGLYNDRDDVDALVRGLHRVKEFFG